MSKKPVKVVQGSIVRGCNIPDEFGRNPKHRFLLVISPTVSISNDTEFLTVAITTKTYSIPDGFGVSIPHHNPGSGFNRTGLTEPCNAHVGWRPLIKFDDVIRVAGTCPVRVLDEVIRRIEAINKLP